MYRYRMLNNRLLGSHLKCTDLTYPNTPIPYLLAKDVIECLPTNIRNAIKTWFSEEARYLENSFVESCIKLFEPPNSDMLQARVYCSPLLCMLTLSLKTKRLCMQRCSHHQAVTVACLGYNTAVLTAACLQGTHCMVSQKRTFVCAP